MTHFHSPALYLPQLPHSEALARALLAALAVVLTVATWAALGAQAARHDQADDPVRIELPAVVISGHRDGGDGAALTLASARAAIDCSNPTAFPMSGGAIGVNLKQ